MTALAQAEPSHRASKSGGEGSRGGHILGHTRSGKTIYAQRNQTPAEAKQARQEEKHYSGADHEDAAAAHLKAAEAPGLGAREKNVHLKREDKHRFLSRLVSRGLGTLTSGKSFPSSRDPLYEGFSGKSIEENAQHLLSSLPEHNRADHLEISRRRAPKPQQRTGGASGSKIAAAHQMAAAMLPQPPRGTEKSMRKTASFLGLPGRARRTCKAEGSRGGRGIGKTQRGKLVYARNLIAAAHETAAKTAQKGAGMSRIKLSLRKAGGEGSRGGKVIGHTRSGKPIYEDHANAGHANFTPADHADATLAQNKKAEAHLHFASMTEPRADEPESVWKQRGAEGALSSREQAKSAVASREAHQAKTTTAHIGEALAEEKMKNFAQAGPPKPKKEAKPPEAAVPAGQPFRGGGARDQTQGPQSNQAHGTRSLSPGASGSGAQPSGRQGTVAAPARSGNVSQGAVLGRTASGKTIHQHPATTGDSSWSAQDHREASNAHYAIAQKYQGASAAGSRASAEYHYKQSFAHSNIARNSRQGKATASGAAGKREKSMKTIRAIEKLLRKASGEGSRGGHILGHTRSGKPIYDKKSGKAHANFTPEDHADASALHVARAKQPGAKRTHEAQNAYSHNEAAQRQTSRKPKTPSGKVIKPTYHSAYTHLVEKPHDYKITGADVEKVKAKHPGFTASDHEAAGAYHENENFHQLAAAHFVASGRAKLRAGEETDKSMKNALLNLIKAGGEGSRGGHILGHTRSGKPIYESGNRGARAAGFTEHDHGHAAAIHETQAKAHYKTGEDLLRSQDKDLHPAGEAHMKQGGVHERLSQEHGAKVSEGVQRKIRKQHAPKDLPAVRPLSGRGSEKNERMATPSESAQSAVGQARGDKRMATAAEQGRIAVTKQPPGSPWETEKSMKLPEELQAELVLKKAEIFDAMFGDAGPAAPGRGNKLTSGSSLDGISLLEEMLQDYEDANVGVIRANNDGANPAAALDSVPAAGQTEQGVPEIRENDLVDTSGNQPRHQMGMIGQPMVMKSEAAVPCLVDCYQVAAHQGLLNFFAKGRAASGRQAAE